MTVANHTWNITPRPGLPRNSRFPLGNVSSFDDTWIKQTADSMELGSFFSPVDGELPAYLDNFGEFWNWDKENGGNVSNTNSNDAWATVALWNPADRRTYMILDRTSGGNEVHSVVLQNYDAENHAWLHGELPPRSEGTSFGNAHVYGRWALDVGRQKMYRPLASASDPLWIFDIATETWSNAGAFGYDEFGGGTHAIVFHEELGELLGITNETVYAWNPDTGNIRTVGSVPLMGGRAFHAHYNWTRKEACFVRSGADAALATIDENENISQAAIPGDVGDGPLAGNTGYSFYDPISGHYLIYDSDGRQIWEYSPGADEWALAWNFTVDGNNWPPFNGHLICPIPEAGVILWLHRSTSGGDTDAFGIHQRLYKHNAVLGGA